MKIGIITVSKVKNYGSALLCYATQELFSQAGFDKVEFIDYKRGRLEEADNIKEFYQGLKDSTKHNLCMGNIMKAVFFVVKIPSVLKRAKVFNFFLEKHLNYSNVYKDEKELYLAPPQADIYCTGGDQMWNEMYNGHKTLSPFYLSFVPDDKPMVSFGTSFGKEELEEWEIPEVTSLLKRYDFITVREETGCQIIAKMGITNVLNILDPTLALPPEKWMQFGTLPPNINNYILVYRVSRESKVLTVAKKIAKVVKKKIVMISYNFEDRFKGVHSVFVPSPEEFVGLINNAEYIISDSFHATAFSINMNRKFITVLPPWTATRIENIVRKCHLEDRIWDDKRDIENYLRDINYETANTILELERNKVLEVANTVMDIAKRYKEVNR